MNKKYKVWVEVESIANRKLAYLFVSHNGNSSTGIRIENQKVEIPLIIAALKRHLTSAMHSNGEGKSESKNLDEDLQNCDLPDYGY